MATTSKRTGHSSKWRSCSKIVSGTHEQVMLFRRDAEFRQGCLAVGNAARTDFDKCQCIAIESDPINLALCTGGRIIASDEQVAVAPQIPVGVGFPANSGAERGALHFPWRRCMGILETVTRFPLHDSEPDAADNRQIITQ